MTNIVSLTAAVTMTSLELVDFINSQRGSGAAELAHSDFLKKVPQVLGGDAGKFSSVYMGGNGQERPCYKFPKREACLMAMSYSYDLQAKVFDRMTALEAQQAPQVPRTLAQALRLAANQAEQIEAQQLQLEQQQPAVEFVDRFVEAKSAKGFREVAKILGIKERDFIADLAQGEVIFKQGSNWLPMAHHQHAGRFTVKTGEANGHAFVQTRFTPEGIAWVAKRYSKTGPCKSAVPHVQSAHDATNSIAH